MSKKKKKHTRRGSELRQGHAYLWVDGIIDFTGSVLCIFMASSSHGLFLLPGPLVRVLVYSVMFLYDHEHGFSYNSSSCLAGAAVEA